MKIVITAEDNRMGSEVHQRFGTTPWLLLVDTRAGKVKAVPNDPDGPSREPGVRTACRVVALGANAVMTGACGPEAYRILRDADILVYSGIEGTAAEVQAWYTLGLLLPSGEPDPIGAAG